MYPIQVIFAVVTGFSHAKEKLDTSVIPYCACAFQMDPQMWAVNISGELQDSAKE